MSAILDSNYTTLLTRLKQEIQTARMKAALSTNAYLLALYWKMGWTIKEQQQTEGWGAKVIDRLAADLKKSFPDMKGISPRNLEYMRAFAVAYPLFVQQSSRQTIDTFTDAGHALLVPLNENEFVQVPLAQIPWYHHVTLLDKIKEADERFFYIQKLPNAAGAAMCWCTR